MVKLVGYAHKSHLTVDMLSLLNVLLSATGRHGSFMVKSTTLCVISLIIFLFIGACATPTTQRLKVDDELAKKEAKKQREIAIEAWMKGQFRLYDVSYGILTKSVDLCNERITDSIGIHVVHKHMFSEEMHEAASSLLNITDALKVIHVAKGSRAEEAGIKTNDVLVAVNDWAVPAGKESHTKFFEQLNSAAEKDAQVSIKVLRDEIEQTIDINPVKACDYKVLLANEDKINAFADGKSIGITTGMMRFVEDDLELSLVISHELAHNIMNHVGAKKKNLILGTILDIVAAGLGVNTQGVFGTLGVQAYSKEFEEEADYVGLYIMALSGLDIDNAPHFWRRMAAVHPDSISYATTHPSTPHRFVLLEKTVQEINQKISSDEPLRPELKSTTDEDDIE